MTKKVVKSKDLRRQTKAGWKYYGKSCKRVLMGLTDRRKTGKNLVDSPKN